MASHLNQLLDALHDFVSCIEQTGGVTHDAHGFIVPMADEEWIDLGAAYERACGALGQKMQIASKEDDDGQ